MIGPNKGSDENLRWAFGKSERSIETSNKSGLTAGRRPFRCYRLNVKLETDEALIYRASARQLHISGNFTLIDNQKCRFGIDTKSPQQGVVHLGGVQGIQHVQI